MYEAAEIDGARAWKIFRRITVPQLRNTTFYVLITTSILALQLFDIVWILSHAATRRPGQRHDDPGDRACTTRRSSNNNRGYASALAWVLFAIIFVFTFAQFRRERDEAHGQGGADDERQAQGPSGDRDSGGHVRVAGHRGDHRPVPVRGGAVDVDEAQRRHLHVPAVADPPHRDGRSTDPDRGLDDATVYVLPDATASSRWPTTTCRSLSSARLDDPSVIIARPPADGIETDRTTVIDGEEETVYLLDVDGEEVEVYRARLTVGGLFVPVDRRRRLGRRAREPRDAGPHLRTTVRELLARSSPRRISDGR